MRVWYCSTGNTPWVNGPNPTLADCPNVGNLAVTTPNDILKQPLRGIIVMEHIVL